MKISIITVVYNNDQTIKDCMDSVLSQTHNDIEYIVIDGLSSDRTVDIIKSYGNRVDKFISEKDNGLYHAMNKGIELATGDIIGFLHSDDFYSDTEVLSDIVNKFIRNPLLDACYGDLIYTNQYDTSRVIRYWKSNKFIPGSFSKGWSPPHPTFFVKYQIYKKFGSFDTRYNISSDIDLMMRFLEVHKINVEYIPQILVKMRIGGISNKGLKNLFNQNLEVLSALKSHNLPKNIFTFFINKLVSRLMQFFQRPSN